MVRTAFNQEKALVGAFSVITNLRMDIFEALVDSMPAVSPLAGAAVPAGLRPVCGRGPLRLLPLPRVPRRPQPALRAGPPRPRPVQRLHPGVPQSTLIFQIYGATHRIDNTDNRYFDDFKVEQCNDFYVVCGPYLYRNR